MKKFLATATFVIETRADTTKTNQVLITVEMRTLTSRAGKIFRSKENNITSKIYSSAQNIANKLGMNM